MERLLISQLLKWKDSHGRKPLILEGARQVAKSLKLYREKYSPKWSVRTSLLPYERNNSSKTINIPLYMLFVLDKELEAELSNVV